MKTKLIIYIQSNSKKSQSNDKFNQRKYISKENVYLYEIE